MTGRDKPWIFRTYAGHSTAADSNALYRRNLAKGQTGLSVAFDLPTQTGYDSDHPLARGEVGKVGVPICHLGDMRALVRRHPARRDEHVDDDQRHRGLAARALRRARRRAGRCARPSLPAPRRTTSSRNISRAAPTCSRRRPRMRLTKDVILFTTREMPRWNPMNVCSYHLQEAGATPVQELAFALATAIAVLDTVKASGAVERRRSARWSAASRSSSMPGCASSPSCARCAPSPSCGTRSPRERYGVNDPKQRLFRYGVQVNSLGLTEQQPENNVARILIEMLAVTLSKNARARAVQLPAWNEALGLPRPWDQQWSLRMQQILAYETDLLEYGDIFDGSRRDRRARSRSSSARRGRSWLTSRRWAARSRRSSRAT